MAADYLGRQIGSSMGGNKSEITCYLLNVVLTVFLFVFVFMFKTVLVLKGKL